MKASIFSLFLFTLLLSACSQDIQRNVAESIDPCMTPALNVTPEDSGKDLGIGKTSLGGLGIDQTFTVRATTTLYTVQMKLKLNGSLNAPAIMVVAIFADAGGVPGAALASSSIPAAHFHPDNPYLSVQDISPVGYYYDFPVIDSTGHSITLTAGTTYWLHVHGTYTPSDTNYVSWLASDSNIYPNGQAIIESAPSTFSTSAIGANRDGIFILVGGC